MGDRSNGVHHFEEDANMSQGTQDGDLLSDLERQGILNEEIKPDVTRIASEYTNYSVSKIIRCSLFL